jgi:uncharacterized LabA/DUF88 family protein
MFQPKTEKIRMIYDDYKIKIQSLEKILLGKVFVYIDYANIKPWSEKLQWHIDLKRLKQFLDSFSQIEEIKIYSGILKGDIKSEKEAEEIKKSNYIYRTKPVKIMKFSIKASDVAYNSPNLLSQFIRKSLLRKYTTETIEYLNQRFVDMNTLGEYYIEDRKCNFDVEIGVDMLLDLKQEKFETCVLWSGDSDFYDPVFKLLSSGKKVVLFATARRVSSELNALKKEGLIIFDIKKIRDFICWRRELLEKYK